MKQPHLPSHQPFHSKLRRKLIPFGIAIQFSISAAEITERLLGIVTYLNEHLSPEHTAVTMNNHPPNHPTIHPPNQPPNQLPNQPPSHLVSQPTTQPPNQPSKQKISQPTKLFYRISLVGIGLTNLSPPSECLETVFQSELQLAWIPRLFHKTEFKTGECVHK